MREKRKRNGNTIVSDYNDLVDKKKHKNDVLLKMKKGPISYVSEGGTRYFSDHPFQWTDKADAEHLLSFKEDHFVYFVPATIEDIEDYYAD